MSNNKEEQAVFVLEDSVRDFIKRNASFDGKYYFLPLLFSDCGDLLEVVHIDKVDIENTSVLKNHLFRNKPTTNSVKYATFGQLGSFGRLGNALFQMAATMSYAIDTGREFYFPHYDYRKYFLKEYPLPPIDAPVIDENVLLQFHYDTLPYLEGKNVNLYNGHAQSSKYFAHNWDKIKPYFQLKEEYDNYLRQKFKYLLGKNTCSIHVRRTDYTTPVNLEYHGVMDVDWYNNAVKAIYGTTYPEDVDFIVFSDDIEWCKQNLKFPNMFFVEGHTGDTDIFDIYLMSMCKNNIICNSSFSWWGAWLNEYKEKIVVAPAVWFKSAPLNTSDIYEPKWIVI